MVYVDFTVHSASVIKWAKAAQAISFNRSNLESFGYFINVLSMPLSYVDINEAFVKIWKCAWIEDNIFWYVVSMVIASCDVTGFFFHFICTIKSLW